MHTQKIAGTDIYIHAHAHKQTHTHICTKVHTTHTSKHKQYTHK